MLSAMDRISSLPLDTKIFCGHEYTLKNFEFGLMVEPENPAIHTMIKTCQKLIENGMHTVPSTLRGELAFNVFMRCRTP